MVPVLRVSKLLKESGGESGVRTGIVVVAVAFAPALSAIHKRTMPHQAELEPRQQSKPDSAADQADQLGLHHRSPKEDVQNKHVGGRRKTAINQSEQHSDGRVLSIMNQD